MPYSGFSKKCSFVNCDSFLLLCRISSLWWFRLLLHFILVRGSISISPLMLVGDSWDIDLTLFVEYVVKCESVWGFSIPTVLSKLLVKTDCDRDDIMKRFFGAFEVPNLMLFLFFNKTKISLWIYGHLLTRTYETKDL